MIEQKIVGIIEQNKEEYITFLKELVQIKSYNPSIFALCL